MKLLLDNKYAPLTFSWGFLEAPFETVTHAVKVWKNKLHLQFETKQVGGDLEHTLLQLEPLSTPSQRTLWLKTQSTWTAFFNNSLIGADSASPISYLSNLIKCRGVAVSCRPHIKAKGLFGSCKFQLFSPDQKNFLNYERSLAATNDGGKWVFVSTGTIQPYERPEQYNNNKIANRFNPEMLEEYCAALGIKLFDTNFYMGDGLLFSEGHDWPNVRTMALIEAQKKWT